MENYGRDHHSREKIEILFAAFLEIGNILEDSEEYTACIVSRIKEERMDEFRKVMNKIPTQIE